MLNATSSSFLTTMHFSMSQGKNHVTYSSIDTYRKNLENHHNIKIKRRWMFQTVANLIEAGYIRRKQLYKNDGNGIITQIPSVMWFTLKGVVWLVSKGVVGAKKVYKSMTTYLKKGDGRAPVRKDFDDGSYKPATLEDQKRLNDLLASVGIDINKVRDGKSPG